jgi:predicted AAA+ superfamily ATPase
MSEKFIRRDTQLKWLNDFKEKQIIKVVTGVRRSGKSTLFSLFINDLLANGVNSEQIIRINLEEIENEELLDYKKLYNYIISKLYKNGFTYVFLDEIQHCKEFEKAVDSLYVKENIDIYLTGSNAYMLSSELATLLSGRYVEIEMFPFSFKEYVAMRKIEPNAYGQAFGDYIKFGGFPASVSFGNSDTMIRSYLEGIYNTILINDVSRRLGEADTTILKSIVKFLLSNVGSPVSLKKITDTINSAGRNISINTVDRYMDALCDCFMFYKVNRFDVKGRQHLKTNGKYYTVDSGLRSFLLSNSSPDIGHILENIVYLELLRRGNKVSIGKVGEKEVDFVTENGDGLTYYQVAASVMDESTLERELAPLREIRDNHPKYILTLDEIPRTANYDGIRQLNVIDWLT